VPSLTVYMPASAVCGPSFPVVVAGAPTNLVVSGSSITFLEVGTDVSEVYNLNSIMGVAINHNSELATGPIVMTLYFVSNQDVAFSVGSTEQINQLLHVLSWRYSSLLGRNLPSKTIVGRAKESEWKDEVQATYLSAIKNCIEQRKHWALRTPSRAPGIDNSDAGRCSSATKPTRRRRHFKRIGRVDLPATATSSCSTSSILSWESTVPKAAAKALSPVAATPQPNKQSIDRQPYWQKYYGIMPHREGNQSKVVTPRVKPTLFVGAPTPVTNACAEQLQETRSVGQHAIQHVVSYDDSLPAGVQAGVQVGVQELPPPISTAKKTCGADSLIGIPTESTASPACSADWRMHLPSPSPCDLLRTPSPVDDLATPDAVTQNEGVASNESDTSDVEIVVEAKAAEHAAEHAANRCGSGDTIRVRRPSGGRRPHAMAGMVGGFATADGRGAAQRAEEGRACIVQKHRACCC
jgi:hypothetical protein